MAWTEFARDANEIWKHKDDQWRQAHDGRVVWVVTPEDGRVLVLTSHLGKDSPFLIATPDSSPKLLERCAVFLEERRAARDKSVGDPYENLVSEDEPVQSAKEYADLLIKFLAE